MRFSIVVAALTLLPAYAEEQVHTRGEHGMSEKKVLEMSDAEKTKLATIFAAAGVDGNYNIVPSPTGGVWIFDPATPAELALAEYALAH